MIHKKLIRLLFFLFVISVFSFISNATSKSVSNSEMMSNMHYLDASYYKSAENIVDSYGNNYSTNILFFDASNDAYVRYDLDGKYSKVSGYIVASNETGSGAKMNVGIFADGILKFSILDYTRQKAREPFEIDLSGVRTLDIKTSNSGDYPYGWIFFVETEFTKISSKLLSDDWTSLGEKVVIDSQNYKNNNQLMKDSFGMLHDGSLYFDASQNAYALFNLNHEYTSLKGKIVTSSQTGSGASMDVTFYCDGEKKESKTQIKRAQKGVDFSIDVTNVDVLKVETTNSGDYPYGWLYIVDDRLTHHEHNPLEWEILTQETCTKEGEKIKKCSVCGEIVEQERISKLGHKKSDEWKIIKEVSCTNDGERVNYCSICKEICATDSIKALGHSPNNQWTTLVEPSCSNEGEEVQYCVTCGEICQRKKISALNHTPSEKWVVVQKATSTNTGVKEQYCTVCKETVNSEIIPQKLNIFLVISSKLDLIKRICLVFVLVYFTRRVYILFLCGQSTKAFYIVIFGVFTFFCYMASDGNIWATIVAIVSPFIDKILSAFSNSENGD